MCTSHPIKASLFKLLILALCLTGILILLPSGGVFADSNLPTVTPSPEPTETPIPDSPTPAPPSATPYPPPVEQDNPIIGPTEVPSSSWLGGDLTTTDRILLVCISVVSVLVVGMIVYLVFNQTRQNGLGDR